jgi:hypothetical protein
MVVGDNKINNEKNAGKLLAILMAMAMQQHNAVHIPPMEHIQGFTGSHWMWPMDKSLGHNAPVAACSWILKEMQKHKQTKTLS